MPPITANSAVLDNKAIAYSPKAYSIFDLNDISGNTSLQVIEEDDFAWVDRDTLYIHGSCVSVVNGVLVVSTGKATVSGVTLYLEK